MRTVMNWSYNGKSSICLYKELHYKIVRRIERQGEETHVHKISKFTNRFRL